MTKEDIDFLKELQNELKTQDNDSQASPRFWVVAENNREYGIESGYADGEIACGADEDSWETVDEFIAFLIENGYLSEDQIDKKYDYDFKEIIEMLDDSDFYTCGYRNNYDVVAPDTMFITKRSCKQHIELNHYHYKEPHTYAMTAWRNPEFERVLKILTDTDWDKIKLKED